MTCPDAKRESECGFTTIEMLVALLVLAITLGTAAQSISFARRGLQHASEDREVARILTKVLAEELPRLAAQHAPMPTVSSGPGWAIELAPVIMGNDQILRARIKIAASKPSQYGGTYLTYFAPSSRMGR